MVITSPKRNCLAYIDANNAAAAHSITVVIPDLESSTDAVKLQSFSLL